MTDPPPAPADAATRIVLVTIPDCHLCDRAREGVARLAADHALAWAERDLTEVAPPHEIWWEQVPLVLVDGEVVCYWRFDESAVRAALSTQPG